MSASNLGGANPKISMHELEHNISELSKAVDKNIKVDKRFIEIFKDAIERLKTEEGHEEHEFIYLRGKLTQIEEKIERQANKSLNLGPRSVDESSQEVALPKIDEIEHYLEGMSEQVRENKEVHQDFIDLMRSDIQGVIYENRGKVGDHAYNERIAVVVAKFNSILEVINQQAGMLQGHSTERTSQNVVILPRQAFISDIDKRLSEFSENVDKGKKVGEGFIADLRHDIQKLKDEKIKHKSSSEKTAYRAYKSKIKDLESQFVSLTSRNKELAGQKERPLLRQSIDAQIAALPKVPEHPSRPLSTSRVHAPTPTIIDPSVLTEADELAEVIANTIEEIEKHNLDDEGIYKDFMNDSQFVLYRANTALETYNEKDNQNTKLVDTTKFIDETLGWIDDAEENYDKIKDKPLEKSKKEKVDATHTKLIELQAQLRQLKLLINTGA